MKNISKLEKRIRHISNALNEKSASRSHTPSKSFLIWKFLIDHNGADRDTIKASFPEEEQPSISSVLLDCVENGVIKLINNTYFANKDYAWDDIGIFDSADKQTIINGLQYLLKRLSK